MRRSVDASAAAAAAAAPRLLPGRCVCGGSGMACALLLAERVRRRSGCWAPVQQTTGRLHYWHPVHEGT